MDRAKERGVRRAVLMTAMGVEFAPEEVPMCKLELELLNSGLDATVIHPNWFMDNFHTFRLSGLLSDGKIYFHGGNAEVSFIDARDIGESTAALCRLTESVRAGHAAPVVPTVTELLDRAPINFDQYARDYKERWMATS